MKPPSCSRLPRRSDGIDHGPAQFCEALAGERGNAQRAGRFRLRRQIAFVPGDDAFALLPRFFDQLPIWSIERSREIHHYHCQIGVGHGLITALDAKLLDDILPRADSRCVHELDRNPFDHRRLRYQVARGAGNLGDDGAILLQQPVEQTALADIRTADNRQCESLMHQFPVGEACDQRAHARPAPDRSAAKSLPAPPR